MSTIGRVGDSLAAVERQLAELTARVAAVERLLAGAANPYPPSLEVSRPAGERRASGVTEVHDFPYGYDIGGSD